MCCDGAERGSEQLIDKLKCLHVKLGQCRPLASAVLRCSPLIQTQTLSCVCVHVQTKQQNPRANSQGSLNESTV